MLIPVTSLKTGLVPLSVQPTSSPEAKAPLSPPPETARKLAGGSGRFAPAVWPLAVRSRARAWFPSSISASPLSVGPEARVRNSQHRRLFRQIRGHGRLAFQRRATADDLRKQQKARRKHASRQGRTRGGPRLAGNGRITCFAGNLQARCLPSRQALRGVKHRDRSEYDANAAILVSPPGSRQLNRASEAVARRARPA